VDERVAHEAAYMLKERPPHGCQQGVLRKHISNIQDQASHCSTSRSIWPRRSTCVEAGQRGRLSFEPKGTWREMELPPHMKQECKQVAEDKLKGVLFSISIQPLWCFSAVTRCPEVPQKFLLWICVFLV
jgi:hypothetical protein